MFQPNVILLEGEVFSLELRLDEILRVEPMPHKDAAGRHLPTRQKGSPQRVSECSYLKLGLPAFRTGEINFYCLHPLEYDILF